MAVNKIVLAYSGGLDTSVILKWLQEEYQCPVIAFAADHAQAARQPDKNGASIAITERKNIRIAAEGKRQWRGIIRKHNAN